jgi:hypothetical protein
MGTAVKSGGKTVHLVDASVAPVNLGRLCSQACIQWWPIAAPMRERYLR